jgi:hypothetical protein
MAIKDPANGTNVAQAAGPGVSTSMIGVDTGAHYDAIPGKWAVNTNLALTRIGGATQTVEHPNYAGKMLQFRVIAGAPVNDGATFDTSWTNRTGKQAPVGKYIVAVAL